MSPSPVRSERARPSRGPRRPLTADAADIARWVDQARQLGRETESARKRLQAAAQQRQALLARLHAVGMSHREIADSLGLSPTVIAHALAEARRRSAG
jgi:DNA-binding NarL/FixJ family response regulator